MSVEQFVPAPTERPGIDTEALRQVAGERFDATCATYARFKARIEYPSRRHGTVRRIPQSVVLANGETYLPEVRR